MVSYNDQFKIPDQYKKLILTSDDYNTHTLLLTMVYFQRFFKITECHDIAYINSVFAICSAIANKYWHDIHVPNYVFASCFNIAYNTFNDMEIFILKEVQYHVYVTSLETDIVKCAILFHDIYCVNCNKKNT